MTTIETPQADIAAANAREQEREDLLEELVRAAGEVLSFGIMNAPPREAKARLRLRALIKSAALR